MVLSPEEHQERKDVYMKGLNDGESAELLYMTPDGYGWWRRSQGLPPNTATTMENYGKRMELYNQGKTDSEIAASLEDITRSGVAQWRRSQGLPAHRGRSSITPEEEWRRMDLYNQGKSDRQIEEYCGLRRGAIKAWRTRRGLPAGRMNSPGRSGYHPQC